MQTLKPEKNALTTQHQEELKRQLISKAELIGSLLNQSYSAFNVYGKSPEEMEDVVCIFIDILKNHDEKSILRAFKIWMSEEKILPTPSDILALINKNKPEPEYQAPNGRVVNAYADMSNDEKQDFDEMMATAKEALSCDDRLRNQDNTKQDYTHFNRMSPAQREDQIHNLRNMIKH